MPKAKLIHHVGISKLINKEFRVYWESFSFSVQEKKVCVKKFIKLISGYEWCGEYRIGNNWGF
jgi:hypothetical protein